MCRASSTDERPLKRGMRHWLSAGADRGTLQVLQRRSAGDQFLGHHLSTAFDRISSSSIRRCVPSEAVMRRGN
jgi:hypothetical protein